MVRVSALRLVRASVPGRGIPKTSLWKWYLMPPCLAPSIKGWVGVRPCDMLVSGCVLVHQAASHYRNRREAPGIGAFMAHKGYWIIYHSTFWPIHQAVWYLLVQNGSPWNPDSVSGSSLDHQLILLIISLISDGRDRGPLTRATKALRVAI